VNPECCERGPVAVRANRTARRPGAQRVGEQAAHGEPLELVRESGVLRPETGRGPGRSRTARRPGAQRVGEQAASMVARKRGDACEAKGRRKAKV